MLLEKLSQVLDVVLKCFSFLFFSYFLQSRECLKYFCFNGSSNMHTAILMTRSKRKQIWTFKFLLRVWVRWSNIFSLVLLCYFFKATLKIVISWSIFLILLLLCLLWRLPRLSNTLLLLLDWLLFWFWGFCLVLLLIRLLLISFLICLALLLYNINLLSLLLNCRLRLLGFFEGLIIKNLNVVLKVDMHIFFVFLAIRRFQ